MMFFTDKSRCGIAQAALFLPAIFTVMLVLPFFGCSSRAEFVITASSAVECSVSVAIDAVAADFISSFTADSTNHSFFNRQALESNLKQAGFSAVSVKSASNTQLAFTAKANSAAVVFSALPKVLTYTPGQGSQHASFEMSVSRSNIGEILALLPRESIEYLRLFLAPLFPDELITQLVNGKEPGQISDQGMFEETMTETEYLSMIRAVYGNQIASSLASGVFEFAVTVPGTIVSHEAPAFAKTTITGHRITVAVPLSALLSASDTIRFAVVWD
jgi:hypothetical protein